MGAITLNSSKYKAPKGSSKKVACACSDNWGIPEFGLTAAFFEPARLIELVKTPYCSPTLGGIKINPDSWALSGGKHGRSFNQRVGGVSQLAFYNHHYFAFPLMEMLNIVGAPSCVTDGRIDLSLIGISELNPLWNDEEMAFYLNPEAALYSNPVGQLACIGDCVTSNFGVPNEDLFWCAGCWGSLTPHSGYFDTDFSQSQGTSLLTVRTLSMLFRTGLETKTYGDNMTGGSCKAQYYPIIPKTQYKMNMLYPVSESKNTLEVVSTPAPTETAEGKEYNQNDLLPPNSGKNCCHPLGKSTILTGNESRNIPSKEDSIYMLFRYKDCCIR